MSNSRKRAPASSMAAAKGKRKTKRTEHRHEPSTLRIVDTPSLGESETIGDRSAEWMERLHASALKISDKIESGEALEDHESDLAAAMLREWAAALPNYSRKRGNPKYVKRLDENAARKKLIKALLSGKSKTAAFAEIAEEYGISNQAAARNKILQRAARAVEYAKSNPHTESDGN